MFGNTPRLSPEIIGRTIVDLFDELHREDPRSEIILVSHGVTNEIRILDDVGVPFDALGVKGIIDIHYIAHDVLGFSTSLESLLKLLRIPVRPQLLHCAGNDAQYTLQSLLAFLQAQFHDSFGQLEELARQENPLQPCCFAKKEEQEEDWPDHLGLDACLGWSLD